MSLSRDKLESAIRAAVGKLAPGMTGDGCDRAMNYIGIWRALRAYNRRLYRQLEADAELGGQEWRARVDVLVETVIRDMAPLARLISRKSLGSSTDNRKNQMAGAQEPRT